MSQNHVKAQLYSIVEQKFNNIAYLEIELYETRTRLKDLQANPEATSEALQDLSTKGSYLANLIYMERLDIVDTVNKLSLPPTTGPSNLKENN